MTKQHSLLDRKKLPEQPFDKRAVKPTMRNAGFTLAELLIALGILGLVATFTIPKVLVSQQSAQKSAITKEYAATISEAFLKYKNDRGDVSAMTAKDLMPYLNYVKTVTDGTYIDNSPSNDFVVCTAINPCIKLVNGAMVYLDGTLVFNGTNNTNALLFHFDPDGEYQGTTNGPGKGAVMVLYYTGRITSFQNMATNTCLQGFGCFNPTPGTDPSWLTW